MIGIFRKGLNFNDFSVKDKPDERNYKFMFQHGL